MKRTWLSIVVVAGMLGLLTLFVGLQYRLLSEAGEAERERMQRRVETDTARFAEDFDREMQAGYYNFQTNAAMWKNSDWSEFNERYDFWKGRTSYPELIRDIYFVSQQPDAPALRYDPTKRIFETSAQSNELDGLRSRFTDDNFKPVYEDLLAMVVPIYAEESHLQRIVLRRTEGRDIPASIKHPAKFGWLVVFLDEATIKERILPELSRKYFPDEYDVAVSDKAGQILFTTRGAPTSADASAPMFNMSPDNLLFFASRDALPKAMLERRQGVVIDQRIESHTFSRTETDGKTGTFKIEVQQPGSGSRPRTTVLASSTDAGGDPWKLSVQHKTGSVDAFVTGQRNQSIAIGLGIYLLLVGGILAIVLSALRSKRFAQRQVDFVSSVSHEFRTPLAVIYSAGENLADGVAKETSQVSRYGELIKGEGKKLSRMVEQILEFAGANSGKQRYSLAPIDAIEIVNDALDECSPLTNSGGFAVETDLRSGLPMILGDRTALSTAIQNLIANSIKYSNGSRWIKISAVNGGGGVKISVEDKGIGISNADLRRVFEPFYRAKEVVDAQISGNGLGLNLVKNIAEAHGGKVVVESKQGVGSKFTIELPGKRES